jgi:hypothetical protein
MDREKKIYIANAWEFVSTRGPYFLGVTRLRVIGATRQVRRDIMYGFALGRKQNELNWRETGA